VREWRLRRRVSGRAVALATLVVLPIAGGAVGAATHTQERLRYAAETAVTVDPQRAGLASAADQERAARFIADIVKTPYVAAAARTSASSSRSADDILADLAVRPSADGQVLRIDVKDDSAPEAVALANGVALTTTSAAMATLFNARNGVIALSDFESGLAEWGSGDYVFSARPASAEATGAVAHSGRRAMRVVCRRVQSCGPALPVHYPFRRGARYTVRAWFRAPAPVRAGLVLGSDTDDVQSSRTRRLRHGWQEIAVQWVPHASVGSATLAVQARTSRPASYEVDDVTLFDPLVATATGVSDDRPKPPVAGARALRLARAMTVLPARPLGGVQTSSWVTVRWTLLGALFGALAALVAVALGRAAAQHRQEP
jgi:hypothetical protein